MASHYILLLRNGEADFSSFSAEQYQQLVADFDRWNERQIARGQLLASANVKDDSGTTLRLADGQVVVDGPYCETKEAVAGWFVVRTEDEAEAIEIAKGCPFLPIGGSVEVREVPSFELEQAAKEATS